MHLLSRQLRLFDVAIWSVMGIAAISVAILVYYDAQYLGGTTRASGQSSDANTQLRVIFTKVDEQFREQLFSIDFEEALLVSASDPQINSENALQISDAELSIWDFDTDPLQSRVVYSALNDNSTSDLWWTSNLEDEPELLLKCEDASCNSPAFSPDGQLLAFTQRGTATVTTSGGLAPPRLWLMDIESRETARIFSDNQSIGYATSWSASGNWISYLSPDSNGIKLFNVSDAQTQFFETKSGELAVWHPNDDRLLFPMLKQVDGQFRIHLYVAEPSSGSTVNLSGEDAEVEDTTAAWSPDGELIAFRRRLVGSDSVPGKQIWLMDKDGNNPLPLTDAIGFDHGQPSWSPDGKYLLYHRFPLKGPDIILSVWVTDIETGLHYEILRPAQRPKWG